MNILYHMIDQREAFEQHERILLPGQPLQLQMLHAAAESVTTKIFQQQKELCFYSSEN